MERRKKKWNTGGDYKVYSVYLVQDSVNYGNIEPEDQSYYFEQQNDYYGESSEQQRSLYLNPSNSKCPSVQTLGVPTILILTHQFQ